MFKVNQRFKKAVSLLTMIAMLATSFVFVGSKPNYANAEGGDLIISEVADPLEGYPATRYVEVYNTSDGAIRLEDYTVKIKMNTKGTLNEMSVQLSGELGSGLTKVIAPEEFAKQYNAVALKKANDWNSFNGADDDFVSIEHKGIEVDFFGGKSFKDQNAVRLDSVVAPTKTFNINEWKIEACKTLGVKPSTPGAHTCAMPANQIPTLDRVLPTIGEGGVFSGTKVGFKVTTEAAITMISTNGGDYSTYTDEVTITEPITIFKVKAIKSGTKESPEATYTYYVPEKKSIKDAKGLENGKAVYIEGVITAKSGQDLFIKSNDGSIVVNKSYAMPEDKRSFNVGTIIEVVGTKDLNKGFATIFTTGPHAFKENGTANVAPREVKLSELSKDNHSELVTVKNVTLVKKVGTVYEMNDGTGTFPVYVDRVDGFTPVVGMTLSAITGYIGNYNADIQLVPRNLNDIVEDSNKLQAPTAVKSNGTSPENAKVELKHVDGAATIYYEIGKDLATTKEPTTTSKKYEGTFAIDENNKVIKAIAVKDGTKNSSVAVFEYFFGKVTVSEIQGKNHKSPYVNKSVNDVAGFVTAKDAKGFYIQATGKDADEDTDTSDAIYVFGNASSLVVGDYVKVSGKVAEYTATKPEKSLSSTQIVMSKVEKTTTSEPKPVPVIIGLNGKMVPTAVVDNDNFAKYDPQEDAIDFFESLEGMLVKVEKPLVAASYVSKDNVTISVVPNEGKVNPEKITKYKGFKLAEGSENPELIQVSNLFMKSTPAQAIPMTGDQYKGDIAGLMVYDYGSYKLVYTSSLPDFEQNPLRVRETTTIVPSEDKLTIASYNIENFNSKTEDVRKNGIAISIVENLKAPDIIGLVEMQDNDGEVKSNNPDASETFKALIDEISKVSNGSVKYEYIQINPDYDKDGGAPGANIRVGFIYKPERVQLATAPYGTTSGASVAFKNGHLTFNPGRIIPEDISIFDSTRKSLAAEFVFKGESCFVIANHFSSKSGSSPVFGTEQPFIDPPLEVRIKQAASVNTFIKTILASNPKANVVALGDFNDFEFAKATRALAGQEMTNLHDTLPLGERVTYVFNGNSQVLDHILVANHMVKNAIFDPVNINAMFNPSEGRVSDHDPVLMQVKLVKTETNRPSSNDSDEDRKHTNGSTTSSSQNSAPTPTQPVKPTVPATDNKAAEAAKEKAKTTGKLTDAEKTILKEAIKTELKAQATSNKLEDRKLLKENIALLNKTLGSVEAKQELLSNPEALSKAIAASVENLKKELSATGLSEKTARPVVTLEATGEKLSVNLQAADIKVAKANGADFKLATADASVKVANADLNADKAYKVAIEKDTSLKGTAPKQMSAVTEGVKLETEFKAVQLAIPVDAAKAKTLGVFKLDEAKKTYVLVQSQIDTITGNLVVNDATNGQYVVAEVKTAFADTSKTWAKDTISQISARRIMVGVSEENFAPEKTVTKAEFAAALLNLIGKSNPDAKDWKSSSVAAANQLGFGANFLNDKTADKAITREEMAYMMAKAYALQTGHDVQANNLTFKDAKNVNKTLQNEVAEAQQLGLVKGMADGSFKPASTGTRAEAAQMLLNLAGNL